MNTSHLTQNQPTTQFKPIFNPNHPPPPPHPFASPLDNKRNSVQSRHPPPQFPPDGTTLSNSQNLSYINHQFENPNRTNLESLSSQYGKNSAITYAKSQTQKGFMKRKITEDLNQINPMYQRQGGAGTQGNTNGIPIFVDEGSSKIKMKQHKIMKKQMQLPKIYNGELEEGSKVRQVNISPIHQHGTDRRFKEQGNIGNIGQQVKYKGRNPGTRSYYSTNNVDYNNNSVEDENKPQIKIIKVDQESFEKLAKSLKKGDPIDKVLHLLDPFKHIQKKLHGDGQHPYLQKIMDRSKRSKTSNQFNSRKANESTTDSRGDKVYVINTYLQSQQNPYEHSVMRMDSSREEVRQNVIPYSKDIRVKTNIIRKDIIASGNKIQNRNNSVTKTKGMGSYFVDQQQDPKQRQRQEIAQRISHLEEKVAPKVQLTERKKKTRNDLNQSNENLDRESEYTNHDKFIKMGNIQDKMKSFKKLIKRRNKVEGIDYGNQTDEEKTIKDLDSIRQRAAASQINEGLASISKQLSPVKLAKKKLKKKSDGLNETSVSLQRCPHCSANIFPQQQLKKVEKIQANQENPSIKQSIIDSLEHSSKLMQYKTNLYGNHSKFYKMPLHYYHNLKLKRAQIALASQSAGEESDLYQNKCSCSKELVKREKQRVSSQSPKTLKSVSKAVIQVSKHLYQPYVPCRRTCSTLHHPHVHGRRIQNSFAARVRSTGRLLQLQNKLVKPPVIERASSQDSGLRKKNEAMSAIDWANSNVFRELQFNVQSQANQGGGTTGEGDDRNEKNEKSQEVIKGKGDTPFGDGQNLLLIQNQELDFGRSDTYSELEVKYLSNLMKQKVGDKTPGFQEEVKYVFQQAERTLESKMGMLLLSKAFESIKSQYNTEEKKQTVVNTIKLLLRCVKMNEAISIVKKILKSIIQREKLVYDVIVKDNQDQTVQNYNEILEWSLRIFNLIFQLQDDHHNMRRPFIYHRQEYKESTITEMRFMKEAIERQFNIKLEKYLNEEGKLEFYRDKNGEESQNQNDDDKASLYQ